MSGSPARPAPARRAPRRRLFGPPPDPPAPEVREKVEPVEVSVLTEAKRLVGRGEVRAALLYAYPVVVADIERALGEPFPAGTAHRQILDRLSRGERLGHVPEFLGRLYALYEPVRYGAAPAAPDGAELIALLTSLYGRRELWALYAERRPGSPPAAAAGSAAPDGEAPP